MVEGEIYEIIGAELSGNADEYKREVLKSWLEESQANVQSYQLLKESWQNTEIDLKHPHEEMQFDNVLTKIKDTSRRKPFIARHFLKVAASISILLVSAWFVINNEKEVVPTVVSEVFYNKTNMAGQKSSFNLPDGTKVWLNAESSLKYSSKYGIKDRKVELLGEAFFDVKKDKTKEFIVTSENFKTTALGTSFNVCAFPGEDHLKVALVTGKVRIDQYRKDGTQDISSNTFLRPGEQMNYSKNKNSLNKGKFSSMKTVKWKDGVLYFEDTCFNDIIKTLERWYGVNFSIVNPPAADEVLFSGEFKDETLRNVLKALSYSRKFSHDIDGKSIIIQFN